MSEKPAPSPARARQVLILEDDASIASVVDLALSKAGLETRTAGTLNELEGLLASGAPDLFLLDINLPDGDGFEACLRLRSRPLTAQTPIIFLTGRENVSDRLRAFQLGAQDYVVKPFVEEELVVRVQSHLTIKIQRERDESQLARLAARERDLVDLMDMVIHDMCTPLSTVKITLDMLAQGGDAAQKETLAVAGQATDAVLMMLNDLLDLRVGRVSTELSAFAAEAPLRRAAAILGPAAVRRGVAVSVAAFPAGAAILSDEKMLLRVALNLLGNAIKFSGKGARVEAAVRREGGRLRLEFSDRGPGVPAADKERVFEKFSRAGEAALSAPGAGIGLAFCRLSAETLGGRVWVEDRPGGGSVFVFDVPAAPAPLSGDADGLVSPAMLKEYRDDCASKLAALDAALASAGRPGADALESVRRTVHRLAGSAGTFGYAEAGRAAARLENRVLASRSEPPELAPKAEEILLALREIRRGLNLPA